ncbi:MAG: hypothetical protein M1831_000529 [Alyxoria varia]|nr:MAG: hypothetical protein M1831_000529 [Alyxoria varia]
MSDGMRLMHAHRLLLVALAISISAVCGDNSDTSLDPSRTELSLRPALPLPHSASILTGEEKAPFHSLPVITLESFYAKNFDFEGEDWAIVERKPRCPESEEQQGEEKRLAEYLCDVATSGSKKRLVKRKPSKMGQAKGSAVLGKRADDEPEGHQLIAPAEEQQQHHPWANLEVPGEGKHLKPLVVHVVYNVCKHLHTRNAELRQMYLQSSPAHLSLYHHLSLYDAAPTRPRSRADDPSRTRLDLSQSAFFLFFRALPSDGGLRWNHDVRRRISSQYLGLHVHYVIPPALLYAAYEASMWRHELRVGKQPGAGTISARWRIQLMRAGLTDLLKKALNRPDNLFDADERIGALYKLMLFKATDYILDMGTHFYPGRFTKKALEVSLGTSREEQQPTDQEQLLFVNTRTDAIYLLPEDYTTISMAVTKEDRFARTFPWANIMTRREAMALQKLLEAQRSHFFPIHDRIRRILEESIDQASLEDHEEYAANGPRGYIFRGINTAGIHHGFTCVQDALEKALASKSTRFMVDRSRD